MINKEILMHLAYGHYAGEASTCGFDNRWKQVFDTEEAAIKAANSLNSSGKARHEVEAYPCYWCSDMCKLCVKSGEPFDMSVASFNWHIGRKLTNKERLVFSAHGFIDMEVIELIYAEAIFGSEFKSKLKVHNRLLCAGENCCIHNPSNHALKNAPLIWRADRQMMERQCKHGIGHPDPDDTAFKKASGIPYDTTHDCDGCCGG